ncbi:MAG: DUF3047 domain-containing protein [Candidatus Orphnella occulta]|nr:DUF3047 domain-containing protein [Candidatus Orphnella occulta]MDP8297712.1 DUF3047 domain-containing protein [Candidatus Orphnella occulta]
MFEKKWFSLLILITLIFAAGNPSVLAAQSPKKFPFKEKDALDEWQEKVFRGRVLYSVKAHEDDSYLVAYSDNTASGIFYQIRFDPKQLPMISWKWKVLEFPKKGKPGVGKGGWIEQDDYAARLYVIFPKLSFNLTKSLEYVWDKSLPVGTIKESPYSKNIKIIVIESGSRNINKWVQEKRNIYEDYVSAFGRKPGKVGAIAIMTDTDNTSSTAEAHYDELKVRYKDESE